MCLETSWRRGQTKLFVKNEGSLGVKVTRSLPPQPSAVAAWRAWRLPRALQSARRTFWTIFYRWETCLIFCKPFKKANGLLLFLDPFPTRPLLLFPLHATFPPSDLLKQMISHCAQANDINDIWATCSSKWYNIKIISHCAQPNYINDIWAQANDIKSGHNYFSITTLPTSINSKLAS